MSHVTFGYTYAKTLIIHLKFKFNCMAGIFFFLNLAILLLIENLEGID